MVFNHRKLLADDCMTRCYQSEIRFNCQARCYDLLPPPPPPPPPPPYVDLSKPSRSISTNMIIMACVIGGSFLLGTLCVIFLQYYSKWKFSRRRNSLVLDDTHEDFLDENHGPVMDHPIWFITTIGLPQSVIDSITVCKYKKEEGLVEGTECSVCLSEFEEDETLRLLPKCSHAFHLPCIDTWLRSHKNCPLCRAPIVSNGADLSAVEANTNDLGSREEIGTESFRNYGDQLGSDLEGEGGSSEGGTSDHLSNENEKLTEILKKGLPYLNRRNRVQSDLVDNRHIEEELQPMRRSVSLNSSSASMIYRAMAEVLEEEGSRHSKLVKDIRKLKKTLTCPGSGGVDDMLVGCLWQNDHLVTVSLGGTISLFSASDLDKTPLSLSGHIKNVTSLAVLQSNPKVILSSSYDGLIVKWIQGIGYSGRLERKETSQIKCFAAVEEEIVSSGFDNKVHRISLHGDQCGDANTIDIGSQSKDLSLALLSPGLALVSTESGVVLLRGTDIISTIDLGFAVTASTITPDGSEAIVGGQDGKLHIYSIKGDTLTEEAVLEKHRGAISVIHYSPDVSMFASADLNREAVVWDRVSREVKIKNMLYHTARINCMAWSPNNSVIATGSLDTCVIIYAVDKPASSRETIKGAHLGGVYGLAFTDEYSVVSSGEDACVRVWKLTAPQ